MAPDKNSNKKNNNRFNQGGNINIDTVFYSPLEKAIISSKLDKMPAKHWADKFGNGEEAKWTGLQDWLGKQQGSVSKSDILQFLKNNRIQVVEVVKGEIEEGIIATQTASGGYDFYFNGEKLGTQYKPRGISGYEYTSTEAFYDFKSDFDDFYKDNDIPEGTELVEGKTDNTKFSQYQTEGQKENYKEILVTLPSNDAKTTSATITAEDLDSILTDISIEGMEDLEYGRTDDENGNEVIIIEDFTDSQFEAIQKIVKENNGKIVSQKTKGTQLVFSSNHFSEPNILVHLRMNTRTDAEGNKVLFLEEVQSDWGQSGKKSGFQSRIDYTEFAKEASKKVGVEISKEEIEQMVVSAKNNWTSGTKDHVYLRELFGKEKADKIIENHKPEGTPTAPFVTDTNAWTKLGLKVAIKEAIKQGADKLAWTTGEQQNDRYDLSKQVDEIRYSKNNDGTYSVIANKNGNDVIHESSLKEKDLEASFGKDVAQRIINNEGDNSGLYKSLKGENLSVGGKGMVDFYDKIVPNVLVALVKQIAGYTPTIETLHIPLEAEKSNEGMLQNKGITITNDLKAAIANDGIPVFEQGGTINIAPAGGVYNDPGSFGLQYYWANGGEIASKYKKAFGAAHDLLVEYQALLDDDKPITTQFVNKINKVYELVNNALFTADINNEHIVRQALVKLEFIINEMRMEKGNIRQYDKEQIPVYIYEVQSLLNRKFENGGTINVAPAGGEYNDPGSFGLQYYMEQGGQIDPNKIYTREDALEHKENFYEGITKDVTHKIVQSFNSPNITLFFINGIPFNKKLTHNNSSSINDLGRKIWYYMTISKPDKTDNAAFKKSVIDDFILNKNNYYFTRFSNNAYKYWEGEGVSKKELDEFIELIKSVKNPDDITFKIADTYANRYEQGGEITMNPKLKEAVDYLIENGELYSLSFDKYEGNFRYTEFNDSALLSAQLPLSSNIVFVLVSYFPENDNFFEHYSIRLFSDSHTSEINTFEGFITIMADNLPDLLKIVEGELRELDGKLTDNLSEVNEPHVFSPLKKGDSVTIHSPGSTHNYKKGTIEEVMPDGETYLVKIKYRVGAEYMKYKREELVAEGETPINIEPIPKSLFAKGGKLPAGERDYLVWVDFQKEPLKAHENMVSAGSYFMHLTDANIVAKNTKKNLPGTKVTITKGEILNAEDFKNKKVKEFADGGNIYTPFENNILKYWEQYGGSPLSAYKELNRLKKTKSAYVGTYGLINYNTLIESLSLSDLQKIELIKEEYNMPELGLFAKGGKVTDGDDGERAPNAVLLVVSNEFPLSKQLNYLIQTPYSAVDFANEKHGNINIETHKESGAKFVVYTSNVYNQLPPHELADDLQYLRKMHNILPVYHKFERYKDYTLVSNVEPVNGYYSTLVYKDGKFITGSFSSKKSKVDSVKKAQEKIDSPNFIEENEKYARGGNVRKRNVSPLKFVEQNTQKLLDYYAPGVEHDEEFELIKRGASAGTYYIYKEKSGDGSPQAIIEIALGDAYEQASKDLQDNYDSYAKFAKDISDAPGAYFDVEILSNDLYKTISIVFTDFSYRGGSGGRRYEDGGEIDLSALESDKEGAKNVIFDNNVNYDTRKVINRADKVISQQLVDKIESRGVTIEELESIDVPVFKYKTQITIHGIFNGNFSNRVGGYVSLILNQNKSLGVKYTAIDALKKREIEDTLHYIRLNGGQTDWRVNKDSTGMSIYISKPVNKDNVDSVKKMLKKVYDEVPDIYIGDKQLVMLRTLYGVSAVLYIKLNAIYQKNLYKFISFLSEGKVKSEKDLQSLKDEYAAQTLKEQQERAAEKKIEQDKLKEKLAETYLPQKKLLIEQSPYPVLTKLPDKSYFNKHSTFRYALIQRNTLDESFLSKKSGYDAVIVVREIEKRKQWFYEDTYEEVTSWDMVTKDSIKLKERPSYRKQPTIDYENKVKAIENNIKENGIVYFDLNVKQSFPPKTKDTSPALKEKTEPVYSAKKTNGADLSLVQYSDKSVAVFGKDTYTYREQLRNLGGTFQKALLNPETQMRQPGWIYPLYKREKLQELIDQAKSGSVKFADGGKLDNAMSAKLKEAVTYLQEFGQSYSLDFVKHEGNFRYTQFNDSALLSASLPSSSIQVYVLVSFFPENEEYNQHYSMRLFSDTYTSELNTFEGFITLSADNLPDLLKVVETDLEWLDSKVNIGDHDDDYE